ncbi:tyrosine-type recombinase/integrase [Streptomyces buecherae]|uniref:Tyrosine-type recombinase/integrase n=1 Tax=Streptomyces buecherae TaxID=2763006 RepID=A0A7H8NDZ9_9ACTN|nr:tyrosine-type recombinase/integrase [Streptomyces buecherae]QKW52664.1 tyrosine-type recombinase/integrase [Streptomyces buecherae]
MTGQTPRPLLPVVDHHGDRRRVRDRLELLEALIQAPTVETFYRDDLIRIPPRHEVYGWQCAVEVCRTPFTTGKDLCSAHQTDWHRVRREQPDLSRFSYARTAGPLHSTESTSEPATCRICPERPVTNMLRQLCQRHIGRWKFALTTAPDLDFDVWLAGEVPYPSYGQCAAAVCLSWARGPMRLCLAHERQYSADGRPGRATLPGKWFAYEQVGRPVPVFYDDEGAFRAWCSQVTAATRAGQVNLRGLPPLVRAEIRWGMIAHAQRSQHTVWPLKWLQRIADAARAKRVTSLFDESLSISRLARRGQLVVEEIRRHLQLVYFTRADSRELGYIDTEHFGVRFRHRLSHFDLTQISQRWLRDLLWDHLAARLDDPAGSRSSTPFDACRRSCIELGAFLSVAAPEGGHDPRLLGEEHMKRFVADHRNRAREGLPHLGVCHPYKDKPSKVTDVSLKFVFNYSRLVLREALDNGQAERVGLSRAFITALPHGGGNGVAERKRSPFSDDVARALADDANLQQLTDSYDSHNRGVRDVWETLVFSGRRCGEVLELRLECIGRYGNLPLLWHDQTKVGNYDEAIRIPERIYQRIRERQRITLGRFEDRHARQPTPAERKQLALFPSHVRNPMGNRAISYTFFHSCFSRWIDELDLGSCVPHQARHTLATNLLRHGAGLHHIRKYLGQVSVRMAEHYAKVASSEIEDVLQHVWVAGPGAAAPGKLLASPSEGMSRTQAEALALDLSRRSTPAEGGFCTFQPVVDGGECPWKLNCEGCDKFVMSGADLLYWRRKREQWRSIAERAPDDATADYLHQVFEPTDRAIDGLEKALGGLGLLDQALALDLRRPQDYFGRIWSTAFRATDLAAAAEDALDADWPEEDE